MVCILADTDIRAGMILVWFVYGLAFFVLGLAILVYPKKSSVFKLAKDINLIAFFGIIHGINEWLDMFIELEGPISPEILKVLRLATLGGSFIFLVRFGTKVIADRYEKLRPLEALPVVLLGSWLAILATSSRHLLMGDVWGRYLLCFPGSVLTAIGLFLRVRQFEAAKLHRATINLRIAGVAFLVYAILAGVFVKKVEFFPASVLNYDFFMSTFGFPVQICRAVCAAVLAVSMVNLLSIFRWETREALRKSEHRCSTIASATPIILFVQDVNSVITFIQGKGLELIGLEADQVVGRPVSEVFPSAPQFDEDSFRALAGEEFSSTVVLGDVVFECCYSSLRDKEGEITGVIGVALDVTAKVRAQKQLDNYRQQVQKNTRMAEIGSMGSIMAKELDEPLAVARLLIERIAIEISGGDSGVSIDESLKKVATEISQASEILARFCSASQIGRGDVAVPVDIYQLAKRVMTAFAQSAKHVNLSIALREMTCVACLPISSHELEQLFFILIQNAIDAANSSLRQHLTISCKCSEQSIELHFSDTCGGIAAERLEHIFEPFFAEETRTGRTGIGLAMAKQIVTSHGGDMRAESEKGKGSTFIVSLPVEHVY